MGTVPSKIFGFFFFASSRDRNTDMDGKAQPASTSVSSPTESSDTLNVANDNKKPRRSSRVRNSTERFSFQVTEKLASSRVSANNVLPSTDDSRGDVSAIIMAKEDEGNSIKDVGDDDEVLAKEPPSSSPTDARKSTTTTTDDEMMPRHSSRTTTTPARLTYTTMGSKGNKRKISPKKRSYRPRSSHTKRQQLQTTSSRHENTTLCEYTPTSKNTNVEALSQTLLQAASDTKKEGTPRRSTRPRSSPDRFSCYVTPTTKPDVVPESSPRNDISSNEAKPSIIAKHDEEEEQTGSIQVVDPSMASIIEKRRAQPETLSNQASSIATGRHQRQASLQLTNATSRTPAIVEDDDVLKRSCKKRKQSPRYIPQDVDTDGFAPPYSEARKRRRCSLTASRNLNQKASATKLPVDGRRYTSPRLVTPEKSNTSRKMNAVSSHQEEKDARTACNDHCFTAIRNDEKYKEIQTLLQRGKPCFVYACDDDASENVSVEKGGPRKRPHPRQKVVFQVIHENTSNRELGGLYREFGRRRRARRTGDNIAELQFFEPILVAKGRGRISLRLIRYNEELATFSPKLWKFFPNKDRAETTAKYKTVLEKSFHVIQCTYASYLRTKPCQEENSPSKTHILGHGKPYDELKCDTLKKGKPTKKLKSKCLHLRDLKFLEYVRPTHELLVLAHVAMTKLLPYKDCECFHSAKIVQDYYEYWRPETVKVILLAESHVFTKEADSASGPIVDRNLLGRRYQGPTDYVAVHLCLGYGEEEALVSRTSHPPGERSSPRRINGNECQRKSKTGESGFGKVQATADIPDRAQKGTPQYWNLLSAISSFSSRKHGGNQAPSSSSTNEEKAFRYLGPLKKGGKSSCHERILRKLQILQDLKDRGIWLIDAHFIGWHITQEAGYYITWESKKPHTITQPRPPKELYNPVFVLGWELYTKHVVRQAAQGGHLELLVPIGKAMFNAITRARLEDAANVAISSGSTRHESKLNDPKQGGGPCRQSSSSFPLASKRCRVVDPFPQPNAWKDRGTDDWLSDLRWLVDGVAPPNDYPMASSSQI